MITARRLIPNPPARSLESILEPRISRDGVGNAKSAATPKLCCFPAADPERRSEYRLRHPWLVCILRPSMADAPLRAPSGHPGLRSHSAPLAASAPSGPSSAGHPWPASIGPHPCGRRREAFAYIHARVAFGQPTNKPKPATRRRNNVAKKPTACRLHLEEAPPPFAPLAASPVARSFEMCVHTRIQRASKVRRLRGETHSP